MEQITETIMQLISSEVCGKSLRLPADICFSEDFLVELLLFSRRHNVAHIVASALLKHGYLENSPQKGLFENELYSAVYAYEKMCVTFAQACEVLELSKIPYIPLKGAVIRDLYPQGWMRTSCDIDILVRDKDLKSAIDSLNSIEGYVIKRVSDHDIVFESAEGITLELHYKLLGKKRFLRYCNVLSKVWDSAKPYSGSEYRFSFDDNIFYFYHILHMAKHFKKGGCGIRPFIDLWLLDNKNNYNYEIIERLLKKAGLLKFAKCVQMLSRVWFSDEIHNETSFKMQVFLTKGGAFGSEKSRLISDNQRVGGKFGYIISRIFVPYRYLKRDYPILEKYPILAPLCEICRLCSLMFGKKKKFKDKYIENLKSVSYEDCSGLFKELGLK